MAGRPANTEPHTEWKIHLPIRVAGAVEYAMFNHALNRPRYGSRKALLTRLLTVWLAVTNDPDAVRKKVEERIAAYVPEPDRKAVANEIMEMFV